MRSLHYNHHVFTICGCWAGEFNDRIVDTEDDSILEDDMGTCSVSPRESTQIKDNEGISIVHNTIHLVFAWIG